LLFSCFGSRFHDSAAPFLSEVALLEQACALHGFGECMVLDAHFKHCDYTACHEVTTGFGTPSNLVEFILYQAAIFGLLRRAFAVI
jgi:hypothetical protein